MLKFQDGTPLTKEEEKDWIRFQKEFNRVKRLVKNTCGKAYKRGVKIDKHITRGKLSARDVRFYNDYVGSLWDTDPIHKDK